MERLKAPEKLVLREQVKVFSDIVQRFSLAARMGNQYGGDRDVYQALGYPDKIEFNDYMAKYQRLDIAKAVIDRPVKSTWQGPIRVVEKGIPESSLAEEWKKLEEEFNLRTQFLRADRLTGIGQFGVLLLGLNDVTNKEGFSKPVVNGGKKLLYVKPYGQDKVDIQEYESRSASPRYGLPKMYEIQVMEPSTKKYDTVKVHYSRVIHITDDTLQSEVVGMPRLQAIYNRLMDLEKLVGGSAEMYWRGARPGYAGTLQEGYQMGDTMKEDLMNQVNEFEHNLSRFLINEGIDLKALAPQVSDPGSHVDVQVQMISAETGIPKRILTGSERGELSSAQDKAEWLSYVKTRREEYAELRIVRPFIDICSKYGVLPSAEEDYQVVWSDVFAPSEKDKVDIGLIRSSALREYTQNPIAEIIIPPEAFMDKFLGLSEEAIEEINQNREKEVQQEIEEWRAEQQRQFEEAAAAKSSQNEPAETEA